MSQSLSHLDAGTPPEQSDPSCLRDGIRLLARLTRVAEMAFQQSGISLPQYRLLDAVAARPQRASEVARRLGVTRPTLSSLVQTLEREGLLRRVPVADDRRGVQLEPTEAGRVALRRGEEALGRRLLELLDGKRSAAADELVAVVSTALDRP